MVQLTVVVLVQVALADSFVYPAYKYSCSTSMSAIGDSLPTRINAVANYLKGVAGSSGIRGRLSDKGSFFLCAFAGFSEDQQVTPLATSKTTMNMAINDRMKPTLKT